VESEVVSVIIPTRNRPESFVRTLQSLEAQAERPELIRIVAGVDSDDEETIDLSRSKSFDDFKIELIWSVEDRPDTLGSVINRLADLSMDTKAIFGVPDDYVVHGIGWDEHIRVAMNDLPDGLGIPYVPDGIHGNFSAVPVLTPAMIKRVGFFMAPYFPFWFGDMWLDEIGDLMFCKFPLQFETSAPEGRGKTRGIRDLNFWVNVFNQFRQQRCDVAFEICRDIYPKSYLSTIPGLWPNMIGPFEARMDKMVEHAAHWESQGIETEATPRYERAKAHARDVMKQQIRIRSQRMENVAA
jgi:hypothetical protein